MEGNFKNDLEEGEWKSYYENGNAKDIGNYTAGKMNGKWEGFFPNGVRQYQGQWTIYQGTDKEAQKWKELYKMPDSTNTSKTGDIKTGAWSYWTEKGIPDRKETYNTKGELNGPSEDYNANGKVTTKGSYKNGKPDGKWEYYFPFGGPMRTCNYIEGKLDGKSVVYNEKGQVIEESHYKNNKLHGLYTSYDERTGKVRLKQEYENGKVIKVLEGKPGM
jgi:antitoxin component YwqK of YwqJK toxin-antitoxin module